MSEEIKSWFLDRGYPECLIKQEMEKNAFLIQFFISKLKTKFKYIHLWLRTIFYLKHLLKLSVSKHLYLLTVCYYHAKYTFQIESTLYSCLNVKELLTRTSRDIWRLSDSNGIRTHSHLRIMMNLSIINILANRVADIYIKLKSITSKVHITSASIAFIKKAFIICWCYMNDGTFINY